MKLRRSRRTRRRLILRYIIRRTLLRRVLLARTEREAQRPSAVLKRGWEWLLGDLVYPSDDPIEEAARQIAAGLTGAAVFGWWAYLWLTIRTGVPVVVLLAPALLLLAMGLAMRNTP